MVERGDSVSGNKKTPQDIEKLAKLCAEKFRKGEATINQLREMWGLEALSDEECNVLFKAKEEEDEMTTQVNKNVSSLIGIEIKTEELEKLKEYSEALATEVKLIEDSVEQLKNHEVHIVLGMSKNNTTEKHPLTITGNKTTNGKDDSRTQFLKLEELCQSSVVTLSVTTQLLINYLKEQYETYGEILKRLERFKTEVLWSADDTTGFKITIIDRAIELVKKEMNDLQHTNRS